jgi:hypothetical protein
MLAVFALAGTLLLAEEVGRHTHPLFGVAAVGWVLAVAVWAHDEGRRSR